MRLPVGYCGLFLFAVILAIAFGGAQIFGDPDTAWHLAAGDLIRETGTLPLTDPWSYTTEGQTWYNLAWLFDVCFSYLFEKTGFTGLYLLTLMMFGGTLVFMAHLCLKRGAGFAAVSATLLLALLVSFNSILARPNLCSILFTVICYYYLCRYRDEGKWRTLVAIPIIMALWSNIHGGFLLAFPVIAIFGFEALLQGNRKALRIYGILFATCIAATLINPYGYGVYYGAVRTLTGSFDKSYLVEWQAAKIGSDIPLTLLLLVMLLAGNMRDKRIALSDRLLAVAMLLLALSSMRHGNVAAALSMPYISQRLRLVFHTSRFGNGIIAREAAIMNDMHNKDVRVMASIMAVLAVALLVSPFPRDMLLKEPPGFPKKDFPVKEAEFIEKNYPHLRFMTDYNLGGFLDYLWRGRVKTFVDGRSSSLFAKETLQDYADFAITGRGNGPKAISIANYYGFEGAIIPNVDPASADWHWNPAWKLVYQGEVAAVFIKNQRIKR